MLAQSQRRRAVSAALAASAQRAGIDALLARLDRVQKSGQGWRADCPTGHRTHGTLSIAQADSGAILLHCFSGCAAGDVLGALGLTLADVMPEPLRDPSPDGRRAARDRFRLASVTAAAAVLSFEGQVVADVACQVFAGCRLSPDDHARVMVAVERIQAARAVLQ